MSAAPQLPHPDSDPARRKILHAAGEIFADQGFQSATVRDICARAGVNVASVNYYFGDKAALYLEVLRDSTCAAHSEISRAVAKSGPPEKVLRNIVFGMCRAMMASASRPSAFRIMAHELSRPTQALDRVVEEVIGPSYLNLRKTLGAILGLPPAHTTTRLCAHSVIAQIIHYKSSRPVIARLWPDLRMTESDIEMLAEHIYVFSLTSVKHIARQNRLRKQNAH